MKTREELEQLKREWGKDPCWDIYNTEGFEEYKDELKAYQKSIDDKYERQRQQEREIENSEADQLGVHGLYRIIKDLHTKIENQHEAIGCLTNGETRTAKGFLRNNPEYVNPSKININNYIDKQPNNQQHDPILIRQLEIAAKTAYVQGVCECVSIIGDDHTLSKKLLTEMQVTKDMAKKFANPETYKTLEKGIFAQKQDQKLEQAQGVKR